LKGGRGGGRKLKENLRIPPTSHSAGRTRDSEEEEEENLKNPEKISGREYTRKAKEHLSSELSEEKP